MEDNGFPKLQASLTEGSDMLVVRSNDEEEFKKLLKIIAEVRQDMRKAKANNQSTPVQAPVQNQAIAPICGIHGVPMVWKTGVSKKTGKPYAFWSCSQRNADGSFCTFKPTK